MPIASTRFVPHFAVVFFSLLAIAALAGPTAIGQDSKKILEGVQKKVLFHAPLDGTGDASVSTKGGKLFTAESLERKSLIPGIARKNVTFEKGGKYGECLRFTGKTKEVLCYLGEELGYREKDWSGAFSFWMRLDPDRDLEPGYCDPMQMTQLGWNNGAFFVDFDIVLPRDFRLGAFSDLKFWNPENIPWEKWPVEKRPMVVVKNPPFSKKEWTHVLFNYEGINASDNRPSKASLYINGKLQGELRQPMKFQWDVSKSVLMLGIDYIGDLDDVILFREPLSEREVELLSRLPDSP